MGCAVFSRIRDSIAKVAVIIAISAVSFAAPAYVIPGFGGTPKLPVRLGSPTAPDTPVCTLDPANADPANSTCRYDDDGLDIGFGGIADSGISAGGVADTGVGIGDSGIGGIHEDSFDTVIGVVRNRPTEPGGEWALLPRRSQILG